MANLLRHVLNHIARRKGIPYESEPSAAGITSAYIPLALVVVAACIWSVANVQIKSMGDVDGMMLNAWVGVFAAPQLAIASLVLEDGQWAALAAADWRAAMSVVYQAVPVVIVGYGGWSWMLRRYAVTKSCHSPYWCRVSASSPVS